MIALPRPPVDESQTLRLLVHYPVRPRPSAPLLDARLPGGRAAPGAARLEDSLAKVAQMEAVQSGTERVHWRRRSGSGSLRCALPPSSHTNRRARTRPRLSPESSARCRAPASATEASADTRTRDDKKRKGRRCGPLFPLLASERWWMFVLFLPRLPL